MTVDTQTQIDTNDHTDDQRLAAEGAASIASVNLLDVMLWERTNLRYNQLDESQKPTSQFEVSKMIDRLRDKPILPATEGQIAEMITFGIDPALKPDRASANKVLYAARRAQAQREQAQAQDRADEMLDAIYARVDAVKPDAPQPEAPPAEQQPVQEPLTTAAPAAA